MAQATGSVGQLAIIGLDIKEFRMSEAARGLLLGLYLDESSLVSLCAQQTKGVDISPSRASNQLPRALLD